MQNAHVRMGTLTFVKQTRNTITDVTVHLNQLVAEQPERPGLAVAIHLASVFGGDVEIGAVAAALHEGLKFQIKAPGSTLFGALGEDPVLYRSSLQVPGRKRPVRHLILVSKSLFETTFGANKEARRTVLYDDSPEFVLHRLAVRFGLPVLPEWGSWFRAELDRRGLVEELAGVNCSPIAGISLDQVATSPSLAAHRAAGREGRAATTGEVEQTGDTAETGGAAAAERAAEAAKTQAMTLEVRWPRGVRPRQPPAPTAGRRRPRRC